MQCDPPELLPVSLHVVAHSSRHGYAVRERNRRRFSPAELYSEGTRVSRSSSRHPLC
jgi:hypothetical protein